MTEAPRTAASATAGETAGTTTGTVASTASETAETASRRPRSLLARVLARPEIGALAAALVIFVFFAAIAPPFRTLAGFSTVLYASSTIGIVAVAVAVLMIGGEFDLSAGVAVTTAALMTAMLSYQLQLVPWVGAAVSLVAALAVGLLNGWLVVRTRIPSFLITLATFFVLQGVNLGVTRLVTGTVATTSIDRLDGFASARAVFAGELRIGSFTLEVAVLWWLVLVAVATWVLLRTRTGNWITAVGGNARAARAVGVPVEQVKIGLFLAVAFCAWFLGQHLLFQFNSVQAGLGVGNEFIYIIAAVVGGALLTGGYGSAVGSALGAFIFGMVTQGIVFAGWDPNWFRAFLGVMLLAAVLVNLYVKNVATRAR